MQDFKIAISGASGIIGCILLQMLKVEYSVVAIDLFGPANKMRDAAWEQIDITQLDDVKKTCELHKPDMVIHCAGLAHQKIGSIDSDTYQRVNSIATENLATYASIANPGVHFIFLSSISVYGEEDMKATVSEESPCKPSSDYAQSKLDAEKRLLRLFDTGRLKKLDILRLAPVYDSGATLNLDRRVFAPEKMAYIRFGAGEQEMSALSKQNLADFIVFRMKQSTDCSTEASFCNVLNVCDESPYRFQDIIRVFRQSRYQPNRPLVGVPLGLVWIATRLAGLILRSKRKWLHSCYDKLAYSLVFDNNRMLRTGFKPKHNLESVFLDEIETIQSHGRCNHPAS